VRTRWPPLVGVGAGIAMLVVGVTMLPRTHHADRGHVPAGAVPSGVGVGTVPSGAGVGAVPSRLADAPTAPAVATAVTPVSDAGRAADVAGSPIANNPVPLRMVRLRVPSVGIDAPVVDVGVTRDHALEIPSDPHVLGRWSGGAEPGEPYGSTVVVGHVDDRVETGALFRLATVRLGDAITAVGLDGRTRTYRVSAVREVAKQQLVTDLAPFRQDVAARLVLVTCGGQFDPVHRNYADNVVAFAVPVPS